MRIQKPDTGEYHPYFSRYIDLVQDGDIVEIYRNQLEDFILFLNSIDPGKLTFRYAQGKWSIKEVLGHIIDTERIMAYRALAIARGDQTALPGFDHHDYTENAGWDKVTWGDIIEEFRLLRLSNISMFRIFEENWLPRQGTVDDKMLSVRTIIFVIAGHVVHHKMILTDRYLAEQ